MAHWKDLVEEQPDFAKSVQGVFDLRKHKALATLRKDGSPRISGIEVEFSDGEIWMGMMPGSLKARDVLRDPRVAVQAMSDDPPEKDPAAWQGDAKISGKLQEVATGQGPESGHRFRFDISEVVLTRVGSPADHLSIESWHEGRGFSARKRA